MTIYSVDPHKVEQNIQTLQRKAGVGLIAVMKNNGYGLGLEWLAKIARDSGITQFAITELADIGPLREVVGSDADVLMLRSSALYEELKFVVENNCIATVGSDAAARALDLTAQRLGIQARAHLKVDTGLGRYGFTPQKIRNIASCFSLDGVRIEGIYSHFSDASNLKHPEIGARELSAFKRCVISLQNKGFDPGIRHMANSAGLFNIPNSTLDAVRIGSGFTGRVITREENGLHPVGTLESNVIDLKHFPKGSALGYHGAYHTKRDTLAAIVPIGTQDGFGLQVAPQPCFRQVLSTAKRLALHEHTTLVIEGIDYPVLGVVDMSLCMVDVTDQPVHIGDRATADINPLMVNPRVQRIYQNDRA